MIFAALGVLANGVLLFVFFKVLTRISGPERTGLWSLIVGTAAMIRVGDMGIGLSVARFVPVYQARGDKGGAGRCVETAALIAIVLSLLLVPAASLLVWSLIDRLLTSPVLVIDARALIIPTMVGVGFFVIGGVFQGALVGCGRTDRSVIIQFGVNALTTFLSVFFLTRYGFTSLGWAYAIGAFSQVPFSILVLRKSLPLSFFPGARFDRRLIKGLLSHGGTLQVAGVGWILFEPAMKILLTRFGGLAHVGYFEMTNRLVAGIRNAFSSAAGVLMPEVARSLPHQIELLKNTYRSTLRRVLFLGMPTLTLLMLAMPLLSQLWLGDLSSQFVFSGLVVCLGWLGNIAANPAYYWLMGLGHARVLAITHGIQAVIGITFGWVLGSVFGGFGVLGGWLSALWVSSFFVIWVFGRKFRREVSSGSREVASKELIRQV